jgi:hypothetical protein
MANWKKFKKFVKKVAKPVALIASIVYPPLIPMIGSALGASGATAAVVGAAALGAGSSLVAGDSLKEALTTGAISGLTAGVIGAVSPTAFDSGLLSGGAAGATSAAAPAASTGTGLLSAGSTGTGLTAGGSGLGLSAGGSGLGITAGSAGASTIGGTIGAELAGISTGIGAAGALSSVGSTVGAMSPVDYSLTSGSSAASNVVKDIASKGLVSDVLKKASEITGISEDTLGKLGSAAVSTLISGIGAEKIADKATDAARIQADAQIEAARIAADAAKFRPVGVTTRFGTSNFGYDAEGNVTSAGYTASDEIKNYQDRLKKLADQGLLDAESARAAYAPLTGAAKSLFSLGESYLAKSPEAVAADYISKQQALVSPSRQTQLAELQNKLFQQGRGGAAVSQGGNLMATSPEYAAYYNAIAQQDLALAARADQEARDRISFGSGLFDTGANLSNRYYTGVTGALAPFAATMDTSAGLESLAERPLTLGTSIGERTTAGTAAGGRFLSEGISGAAATMAPSNAFTGSGEALSAFSKSPEFKSALNNIFGVGSPEKTYTAAEVLKLFGT